MPSIRPFQFTGLARLTRQEASLHESLSVYFGTKPLAPDFLSSLGQTLEAYLKEPCRFSERELHLVHKKDLQTFLPRVGSLLVVGAAPTPAKILVELDGGMVAFAIDRLLGGAGDVARIQRALTEIEEGVLSYLVLKVLSQFQSGWQTGKELTLTLDRFASKLEEVQDIIDADPTYHVLGIRLAVGKRIGYLRILLPSGLVQQSFSQVPPQTGGDLGEIRRVLQTLGEARVEGRVEIATVDLSADDIAQLGSGDIILLENHQVKKTPNGLLGEAFVKIGDGVNGGVRGKLLYEGEIAKLEITEIVVQEQPVESPMSDGEAEESGGGDNLAETEGLLRDVAAPVVVELGRLRMSTSQVVRLRTGQILRLPRGPNDPVNLVVNGKLFARGELIEVDGELGIRLIQVAGS